MSIFTNVVRALGGGTILDDVEAAEKAIGLVASNPSPENIAAAVTAAATATTTVTASVAAAPTMVPVAIDDAVSLLAGELKTYLTTHYGEVGTIAGSVVLSMASALETAAAPKAA